MITLFDEATHTYSIDGRPVPSVTQVLRQTLGDAIWRAGEFYLERGRAVHACAALIAQGKPFTCDDRIAGQVEACRRWFADCRPVVEAVELRLFSVSYQYAGTLDLRCKINGRRTIVDWKTTLSEVAKIQIGGYAAEDEVGHGMVVALREDGRYRASDHFRTAPYERDFLALRSVYAIRQRLGLIETQGEKQGEGEDDR